MKANYPPISQLIPHQHGMCLIDEIVHADKTGLIAKVYIHSQSIFFQHVGVPSWVGLEYMAQAVAAHAGYMTWLTQTSHGDEALQSPPKIGVLLGTQAYDAKQAYFCENSVLHIHAYVNAIADNGLRVFDCKIIEQSIKMNDENDDEQKVVAQASIKVFVPETIEGF